jgi:hypothetical protein
MLREERSDFTVRGTVRSFIISVNKIIESAGTCTTEFMATSTLSRSCHHESQTVPRMFNVIS